MPLFMLIVYAAQVAIYGFGGASIFNETDPITVGDISRAIMYITMICFSLIQVGMIFSSVARASASAKRINEVLNCAIEIVDGNLDINSLDIQGEIEFKDVSFTFNKEVKDTISHASFKVNKGETIAFIGPTGSGKTYLAAFDARNYNRYNRLINNYKFSYERRIKDEQKIL